jgi:hypothetical protein
MGPFLRFRDGGAAGAEPGSDADVSLDFPSMETSLVPWLTRRISLCASDHLLHFCNYLFAEMNFMGAIVASL